MHFFLLCSSAQAFKGLLCDDFYQSSMQQPKCRCECRIRRKWRRNGWESREDSPSLHPEWVWETPPPYNGIENAASLPAESAFWGLGEQHSSGGRLRGLERRVCATLYPTLFPRTAVWQCIFGLWKSGFFCALALVTEVAKNLRWNLTQSPCSQFI